MKSTVVLGTKKIALVGVMTAVLEGVKLALAAIPNVEAVTLLCAVYGYAFGGIGMIATSLFVVVETFIWGVNTWVLSYIIHWNSLCLVFWILSKKGIKNRIVITAIAVIMTVWFGVLTSLVEIGLFGGKFDNFGYRFSVYYVRGIAFYAVQTVCNLILFPVAFRPMSQLLIKLKNRYYSVDKGKKSGVI